MKKYRLKWYYSNNTKLRDISVYIDNNRLYGIKPGKNYSCFWPKRYKHGRGKKLDILEYLKNNKIWV